MKRIAAILTSMVLVFSLAACGSQQAGPAAGSEAASTASSEAASAASSEAASTAQTKTEEQLLAEENDILGANDELWEKVFASMDKNVTQTTLSNNYGEFLMSAVDNAKDQFTEEEYASLKADADKIREIENQIAALPQEDAASQSAAENGSTFPQFEGKDLDGNSVDSSLFANNAFTVVNFWFSGCKPCVDEMDDLDALNQRIKEQGGEVIGVNTETLDATRTTSPPPRKFWNPRAHPSAISTLTLTARPVSLHWASWPSPLPVLWTVRATSSGSRSWAVLIRRPTWLRWKS